ncbi:glycosyltransferase [Marinifaba aquimaris]|uniref:glycosyltransferase n=1 Tax=Marinifaba aquimaris TaxID=2741323 RepID=UPI001FEA701A|nr:glycosyltransferase [Marinifaba aquimaris]
MLDCAAGLYRTGWLGSKHFIILLMKRLFKKQHNNAFANQFLASLIDSTVPLDNTKKFFDDPAALFPGVFIVLRQASDSSKGVLLIKYSYYFPLFFKLFDVVAIAKRYHIVLEPSWAGTCEAGIMAFATLEEPVFVMAYENRDYDYLAGIETNLVPVRLSSNWWVDHRNFSNDQQLDKEIDIAVVSSWANFKRHYFIFKALSKIKQQRPLKVSLVGYPADMTMADIQDMVDAFGLTDNVQIQEWLPPEEVSNILQRSKIHLLWSRFEGLNRSIIEGMFCGTPCILREGFNYGQKYPYINEQTGIFSSEGQLAANITHMLDNYTEYSPREYVMANHTPEIATQILHQKIKQFEVPQSASAELAFKVNALHGMAYMDKELQTHFDGDYQFILSKLKVAS